MEEYIKLRRAFLALSTVSIILAAPLLVAVFRSGAAPSTDSLLGYWKFEEANAADTKVDSSGDSRSGAPSGTVLPQPSVNTPPTNFTNNRSLTFGVAANNAVNVASANEIDDLAALSGAAWVYPTSYDGDHGLGGRILDKTDSTTGWSFYVDGGKLRFRVVYNGTPLDVRVSAVLPLNTWAHVGVTWDGTASASGVKLYIDGVEQSTRDIETDGVGTRATDDTFNLIIGNNSALNRSFGGDMDEVRLYGRTLATDEFAGMAAGGHPPVTWTGAVSSDYENTGNWSTGAIPDPYAHVIIADTARRPAASANFGLAGLTINSGAHFDLIGYNLTMNDQGVFENNGTLQLRNSQTISGLTNDSDSGTILLTPTSDTTGLKLGNNYHDLIVNVSTLAHWPLDETVPGSAEDISGYSRHGTYEGAPLPSSDVPATNFVNPGSLTLDGVTDALTIPETTIPQNATWCAWVRMDSGDGVILGGNAPGQYALAVYGSGSQVRAYDSSNGQYASWSLDDSLYGNWHNLCVTQAFSMGTHDMVLYVDGQSAGGINSLLLGVGTVNAIGTDGADYFAGEIDDVRIYSRALNGAEIVRIANGGGPESTIHSVTLSSPATIHGDLRINSGAFDVSTNNYGLNVAGDFENNGGVFQRRSGTVTLTGDDQAITSSNTFYGLTKQVSEAATLTFAQGSTTTITGPLTLAGANGELLSLRSAVNGQQWFVDPQGTKSIGYLDVMDSHNINGMPVDMTNNNITDSGNNDNWTINMAPNDPTDLGGSSYINGGFVGDSTPTLTFNLSDDNPTDQLRYRVQVDDDSDFSSPEVDYTSALDSQGPRSFTVGQTDDDDTYHEGSDGMTLPTGNYYWRVQTIDNYIVPYESGFAVANSGSMAFQLDVTPPVVPGVPTTASGQTEKWPVWNWTASSDAESGLGSPTYTLQWSVDNTFNSGVSSNTTNNLTFTHGSPLSDGIWYFRVRATDAMGNHSAWATSASHLIDTTGPTTPVAPYTPSPTGYNTPNWSWAAPTDLGIGLAAVPYTVQWSTTSNFSANVHSNTSAINSYMHSVALTDGTWYMRVKAVDGLGNESAWSANGTLLVDTTPPSIPGTPYASNPTNDNTPSWTWDPSIDAGVGLTATPYTIQWSMYADFSNVAGNTTSATPSFTHPGDLADGTWYIRINARDTLLNQSAWSPLGTVTIDTVSPDVPAAPATTTPTNDDTPTWTWPRPDDNAGGVGLATTPYEVEWSQDEDFNTVEGSASASAESFTHGSTLAEGTWYFRVRATDLADNTSSYSDPGEVYIDITPPTVPGDPSTADPVNEGQPTWTWTASTDSGIGMATNAYDVQWSLDNTFVSGVFNATATTNSFLHTDVLADGTWYFRIRGVDTVGNQSAWSNAGSKVVDIDPPTVPGTPATTTPTADNTPEWTWTPSTDAGVGLDELPYMIEWSQDEDFLLGVDTDTIEDPEFTHTGSLADGTWYFRVRAIDDVGNISEYSEVGEVFVDATAPTVPGTPATTTPTANDTPTWTWTASNDGAGIGLAEEGYLIEWTTDADFIDDVESAAVSTNSFPHTGSLADGTWYFRVSAIDDVGNQSAWSDVGTVQVDDTPPSAPGQPITMTPTNNNQPTWTWTSSTDNGVGLRNPAYDIQWSLDEDFESGILSGQVNTAAHTHGPTLADGTWYFRVRAVDTLDNTSAWSDSGEVLISTGGPSAPGQPTTTHPTTDTTPTWTWDASTSPAGLANPAYYVEWSQDSDFLVGTDSDTVNTPTFPHIGNLADGVWYFRVRAEDNTGIFSEYSASGMVRIDTTAPTTPGTPDTTTPTNDRTPTWTWDASTDSGVGLAATPYEIEWSDDNTFNTNVSSATAATEAFTHGDDLADGTWYFRVRAVDTLDNTSSFSGVASVVVDASAPTTPGTPDTTTPTNDRTPTWTWDASTDSGVGLGTPAYEVQWSQQAGFGSGVFDDTTLSSNFTHGDDLADGTWYFRVRATDTVGNQTAWSGNGQVVVDRSVPTVPGTPATGAQSTNNPAPTWTWDASTDSGVGLGTPAYEVQWSQDPDFLTGVSSATAAAASFTHSSTLAEGYWHFRVRAVDAVGNQSGYSGMGTVYVDTDLPSSPGTPTPMTTPTSDNTPSWTWAESTDDGFGFGDEPYELQWSQDSNFVDAVQSGTSADESFLHTAELSDGSWHFRVRAVDDAGNQSAWSSHGTVFVDASAPTLPGNLSTPTPTKNALPTWTWDASTDSGIGLVVPAYEIAWSDTNDFSANVTALTTDEPTYTHSTELGFGVWYFRVRAADQLDNRTAWVTGSVYIDSDPPVISQVSATPGSQGVLITWQTDEIASTRVEYGFGDTFSETTPESNTAPRVTAHSVPITGLASCSAYRFRIISIDQLDNEAVSVPYMFTTTACSGNAAILAQSRQALTAGGGQASLNSGTAALQLVVPASAVEETVDFQIKQLSPAPALGSIGQPAGRVLVGSHVYDLKALRGENVQVTNFGDSLTISITYSQADIAGFETGNLAIFRHNGTSWQQLDGCQVNTQVRIVSCQTANFSVFGLFGTRIVPTAPAPVVPEGDGTVEPDPVPEIAPGRQQPPQENGQIEAATENRGLSAAVTRMVKTVVSRPVWWVSLLLLGTAIVVLLVLRRRRAGRGHVPYGIHRDD